MITNEQLKRLRALRLWHWKQCKLSRDLASSHRKNGIDGAAWDEAANSHMFAVQTLNEFFPAGDTAERDSFKVQA